MPDEQEHPASEQTNKRRHPLLDAPPPPSTGQQPEKQGVRIPMPMMAKIPRFTYALIAINIAIWSLRFLQLDWFILLVNWGVMDVDAVLQQRQIYRLFTAMFLHYDPYHILFNCMAIYYIGRYVELFFGHRRFLVIYFLGGVAGSILSVMLGEGGLGASGAVMAIWGAEAIFWYQHRKLFGAAALSRLRWTGFIIAFNFFIGFTANAAGTANIGNFAHLGGLVGGAILGWLIGPRLVPVRLKAPQEGQAPVQILQVNPLMPRVRDILIYSAGLAALLLFAITLS